MFERGKFDVRVEQCSDRDGDGLCHYVVRRVREYGCDWSNRRVGVWAYSSSVMQLNSELALRVVSRSRSRIFGFGDLLLGLERNAGGLALVVAAGDCRGECRSLATVGSYLAMLGESLTSSTWEAKPLTAGPVHRRRRLEGTRRE